jgi:type I restriction enzyme S subunit
MTVDPDSLPEGWTTTFVGDLLTLNYGKGLTEAQRKSGPVAVYGSNGVVGSHYTSLTTGPTIIVGRKGSVGAIHLSPYGCWPIDTTYYIDDFKGLDPQYLIYLLRSLNLAELDKSTAVPGLNRDDVYKQAVCLPPLAEQERIVAQIEILLTRVNAAKENLAKVPAILKRFRQAVLAAACSGRLTADWREQQTTLESASVLLERIRAERNAKSREPDTPNLEDVFNIPTEWIWCSAAQVCTTITKGTTPASDKMSAGYGEIPYIKVYNLTLDGTLDFTVKPTFIPYETHSTELVRSRVKPGDVLMNIVGPPLGKISIVPSTYPEWNINQAIAVFPFVSQVNSRYFVFCLLSETVLSLATNRAKATVGQFNLTLEICRTMAMPLPPLEEQEEIVRRVKALFRLSDAIANRVQAAAMRADRLTQSILAKAVRGELVPTEAELARQEGRTYESASELMERIRCERNHKSPAVKSDRRPVQQTMEL